MRVQEDRPPWWTRLLRNHMLLVLVGGAVGSYARYWIGWWFSEHRWGHGFPWAILAVNVVGSFLLGFLAVLLLERLPREQQHWYLLLGTGFCGGFTTFSTFEWDTYKLLRDVGWRPALWNVLSSVLLGFVGVVLGVTLAEWLWPKP